MSRMHFSIILFSPLIFMCAQTRHIYFNFNFSENYFHVENVQGIDEAHFNAIRTNNYQHVGADRTYSHPVNCLQTGRSLFKFSTNRVKLIEHEMRINHNAFQPVARNFDRPFHGSTTR